MDEVKLVRQLKSNDKAAFDALYKKYKNILLRMAFMVCGQLEEAEDIVQETFIKCYMHIGELKKPEGFKSWLFQILYRTAYRHVKKCGREIPSEEINTFADATDGVTSLDRIVRTEAERQIMDAVSELDIKHRMAVIMYYYNEMSTREIAKALSCTEGTVKSRLYTARKKLKTRLLIQMEGGSGDGKKETLYFS